MVLKEKRLNFLIEHTKKQIKQSKNDYQNPVSFLKGKLEAYEEILKDFTNPVITIDNTSLSNRELFIYISVSLALSPLLTGMTQEQRQLILRKVCGEFQGMSISNGEVYEIFHAIEKLNTKLGLALNKILNISELSTIRENILSDPKLIEESIKKIKEDPELIKQIQDVLSKK